MSIKVEFGGKPIVTLKTTFVNMVEGIMPSYIELDFIPEDAQELLKDAGAKDLIIEADGKTTRFKRWYVQHEVPCEFKEVTRLIAADRRVRWNNGLFVGSFNMRRRVGSKVLPNPSGQIENRVVDDKIGFQPWSINDGKVWQGGEILDLILKEINEYDGGGGYGVDTVEIDWSKYPIEGLVLNDNYGEALSRLLEICPQLGVTVNQDGLIQVFNKSTGYEDIVLKETKNVEIFGAGVMKKCDMSLIRPKEIHVYFEREIETRFDGVEVDAGQTYALDEDAMEADNVLQNPDWDLNGIPQGTWINYAYALAAFGDLPVLNRPLRLPDIQIASVPFNDLWSAINLNGSFQPDRDWGSRVSALQGSYRRIWQIRRQWRDRIRYMRPYRIGIVNKENGTRAPAVVYSDYARTATQRSLIKDFVSGNQDGSFVMNYSLSGGTPWTSPWNIDSSFHAAPARLSIVDSDQGIIAIDYTNDIYNYHQLTLPSMVELKGDNTVPGAYPPGTVATANIKQREAPIGYNVILSDDRYPKLTGNYRNAMIFTCAPAAPNNKLRLQKIVIKPKEIAGLLPTGASYGLEDAKGPVQEIYIGANIATAMVAWVDGDENCKNVIKKAFGVGFDGKKGINQDISADIKPYIVNLQAGNLKIGDEAGLYSIADAFAAVVYASYANRVLGKATTEMLPTIQASGWIRDVTHMIGTNFDLLTTINAPPSPPRLDPISLLDQSTRRIVRQLADAH